MYRMKKVINRPFTHVNAMNRRPTHHHKDTQCHDWSWLSTKKSHWPKKNEE